VLDVSQVPQAETCSQTPGLKELCVTGLRDSLAAGLEEVLNLHYAKTADAPEHTSTFRMVELTLSASSGGSNGTATAEIAMKWQFVLQDAAGQPVLQLAERTVSPMKLQHIDATDSVLKSLVEAVVERVSSEVARANNEAPRLPATETTAAVSLVGAKKPAVKASGSYLDTCPRLDGESVLARARRCKAAAAQASESP
jgi:hypothetical protein